MCMPYAYRFLLAWLFLALLSACATDITPGPPTSATPQEAIQVARRAFADDYIRNNSNPISELYSADAMLRSPGREAQGRSQAKKLFAWGPKYRQLEYSLQSSALELRGDTAIDVGTWHSTSQHADDAISKTSGPYLIVWVREADGAWRIKYEIWYPTTLPALAK